jgi:hypothetical protein
MVQDEPQICGTGTALGRHRDDAFLTQAARNRRRVEKLFLVSTITIETLPVLPAKLVPHGRLLHALEIPVLTHVSRQVQFPFNYSLPGRIIMHVFATTFQAWHFATRRPRLQRMTVVRTLAG